MILPDVNILVYAFHRTAGQHVRYRSWLEDLINGSEPYAVADIVLSAVLRIATSPIFGETTQLDLVLEFLNNPRGQQNCVVVNPGPRHWEIFVDLCKRTNARANLISDAYLAALAIESNCELITTDRDFARFPGLRWRPPF